MTTEQIKECPICFKEIDNRAKKCPYCHHWQTKWHTITFHPLFGVIPIILILAPILYMFSANLEDLFSEGADYADHINSLEVKNTKMSFGATDGGNTVCVIGDIFNKSPLKWKEIKLEVQYFNEESERVDVVDDHLFEYTSSVIPNTTSSFKISSPIEFPKTQYHSFKVFIRHAKDGSVKW